MWIALRYGPGEELVAAAPACDVMAYGNSYWADVFPGQLPQPCEGGLAHVFVEDSALCSRLLQLGIDQDIDGQRLAGALAALPAVPSWRDAA